MSHARDVGRLGGLSCAQCCYMDVCPWKGRQSRATVWAKSSPSFHTTFLKPLPCLEHRRLAPSSSLLVQAGQAGGSEGGAGWSLEQPGIVKGVPAHPI
uniref:Uncharacterized protein n=1 Tax=Zonotrichia albicollis TaxID=44394 RepID=A0A8D2M3L7_ZONAL